MALSNDHIHKDHSARVCKDDIMLICFIKQRTCMASSTPISHYINGFTVIYVQFTSIQGDCNFKESQVKLLTALQPALLNLFMLKYKQAKAFPTPSPPSLYLLSTSFQEVIQCNQYKNNYRHKNSISIRAVALNTNRDTLMDLHFELHSKPLYKLTHRLCEFC